MTIVNYVDGNPGAPGGLSVISWTGLAGGNTGQPMQYSNLADKTVQVFGTIGAAILIQGSNDPNVIASPGSAIWSTLNDNFGNALSFSSAGLSLIAEAPQYIRPSCGAGTTSATVIIVSNRS
jgi:hypothetical protein